MAEKHHYVTILGQVPRLMHSTYFRQIPREIVDSYINYLESLV